MPNPMDDSRANRILAFLSTQRAPLGVGAIVTAVAQDGETQDATRWTAALTHLAAVGKVDVSGNYRKKYALARAADVEADHSQSDELDVAEAHTQALLDAKTVDDYDAASEFFGAAPAGPAVRAMLAAGEDPVETEPRMEQIVAESVRQESVQRGVPEHLLTGAEPPHPELVVDNGGKRPDGSYSRFRATLAQARAAASIPPGVYFSVMTGNFYDYATGYGKGPYFHEQWSHRSDEFPSRQDLLGSSEEQFETSTSYDDAVDKPVKNTVLLQRTGGSNEPDWLEVREVYRAAVQIRAANTGWGIDAGLDADVREARALLAEVRHQLATDAPLGEHYREGDSPQQQTPAPSQRAAQLRPPMSVDLGDGHYYVKRAPNYYEMYHDHIVGWRGRYESVDKILEQLAVIKRVGAAPPRPASSDEQPWAE